MSSTEQPASFRNSRWARAGVLRGGLRACALTGVLCASASAADLNLTLHNIEEAQGTVRLAVYASEADFRKTFLRGVLVPPTADKLQVTIEDLPVGEYAVMAYQDLNDNEELDRNLLGIPSEPWGSSLNEPVIGAPRWNNAKFELPADGANVTIRMQ